MVDTKQKDYIEDDEKCYISMLPKSEHILASLLKSYSKTGYGKSMECILSIPVYHIVASQKVSYHG